MSLAGATLIVTDIWTLLTGADFYNERTSVIYVNEGEQGTQYSQSLNSE